MRLEDIVARLNRFERADEKPFEAVNAVSEFNQRAYELFGQPLVQAFVNEYSAKLSRQFIRCASSAGRSPTSIPGSRGSRRRRKAVKAQPQAVPADDPCAASRRAVAELASASLDCYRALRDALPKRRSSRSTATCSRSTSPTSRRRRRPRQPTDPRELPFVKEALASIDKGGYAEALARVAFLMAQGRAAAAVAPAAGAGADRRTTATCCRSAARECARIARRAGDHRALRAGEGDRDAAGAAAASAKTGSACSRCSSGWPIRACGMTSLRRSSRRCSHGYTRCCASRPGNPRLRFARFPHPYLRHP